MRVLLLCLCLAGLSGCQLIYKLPTRQGNVIEQKDLDKLKVGMTRDQVKFVMGTPLAATPFRSDRWDYVGYYKSPRGEVTQRTVTLYFDQDVLAKLDGVQPESGDKKLSNPDVDAVLKGEAREKTESERAASDRSSGVVISPAQSNVPASENP